MDLTEALLALRHPGVERAFGGGRASLTAAEVPAGRLRERQLEAFGLVPGAEVRIGEGGADLGAVAGMTRQVPVFRGEGRASGGLAVQQAAWAMTVLPTAIVALGLVVAGIWAGDGPLGPALIAFASLLVSMRLLTYFDELAGAQKLFHLRSRATLALRRIPPSA